MKKPFLISFAVTATILLSTAPANAQDGPAINGNIVAGVVVLPDYEGADDYTVLPLLGGRIGYGRRYFEVDGTTVRANVVASDTLEIGPVANLTFGRDDDIASLAVAALGEIEEAYEVGAFAALSGRVGENGRARLAIQAAHDVSDIHRGLVATARASYGTRLGKLGLGAELSASYADADYMRTYFSVDAAGASASGLPVFSAREGFKDIGLTLTASLPLGGRWSINAIGGYRRLLGDAAASPIVKRAGSADQLVGGIGLGWSF